MERLYPYSAKIEMDIVSLEILGITLHHKGRLQSQECGEQGKSPEKLFEAFDSLA